MAFSLFPLVGADNQTISDPRIHCLHGDFLVAACHRCGHDIEHRVFSQKRPISPLDCHPPKSSPWSHIWSSPRRGIIYAHGRRANDHARMCKTSRDPNRIPRGALRAKLLLSLPSRASVPRHHPDVCRLLCDNFHYQRSAVRP
jgi:hypothetical protein